MAGQSVIGALRVNLGLDSAQFTKGLTKSQQKMAQFARRVKQAAAAAAVAFAAAVVKMTTSGLSFIDSQAKMARSIDGTVDGLRALQLAGGDAGVSADAVGQAMQKLGRRLDEAQTRGGPVADALDRIGLSAADLMTMDADERLAAIADRAKELGFTAQQTAGLLGEFGIRNAEMSLLVMQGGDAIRAAREEVAKLGLSLNEVDTLKVEQANDAFSRIRVGVEALSNRLAVAFAPALEAMSNAFVALMREGGGLRIVIDALGENIGRIAAYAAGFAAVMAGKFAFAVGVVAVKAVMGLSLSLVRLKTALIKTGIGALIVGAGLLIEKFASLVKSSGGFGKSLGLLKDVAVEVFGRIKDAFAIVPAAINAGAAQMSAFFAGKLADMAQTFQDFTWKVADGLNSIFGGSLTGARGLASDLEGAATSALLVAGGARETLSQLTTGLTAPLSSLAAMREHMTQTAEETDGAATSAANLAAELADLGGGGSSGGGGAGSVGEVTTAVETLGARMEAVKSTMQSAFTGLVTGAKSLKDTLGDMLSTFADMLANQAFQSLFAGGFGGLFPIPANANGTNNFQGGLTSVNERGGEIMNLPRGTQIIPNDISKRMADRNGGAQNVHVTVGVSADSNGNLLPFVASVTEAGIQQNNKRIATAQGRPT